MNTVNFFALLIAFTFSAKEGHGQVLLQHSGATNPTTEGFSLNKFGNPTLRPVLNDQGMNAWSVQMLHTDGAQYIHILTASEKNALSGSDWNLTYTLRILQAPTTPSYDISSGFSSGTEGLTFYFGQTPSGDPTFQVREGSLELTPVLTVTGAGSTYNTFSLFYHRSTDSADLLVNGSVLYPGIVLDHFPSSQGYLYWSGFQHTSDVSANWNLVSLSVVPEPSVTILALGAGLLSLHRFKRHQHNLQ